MGLAHPAWLRVSIVTLLLALALWFQIAQVPPADEPRCHYNGVLPDRHCTPGATLEVGLGVVCTSGYSATVRPPTSYTTPLKRALMRAYGVADQPSGDFELDHLVSLEIGGHPTDPGNLWPEPIAEARTKDRVENAAHEAVCRGDMDLDVAQTLEATDWHALGLILGVLSPEEP
jgi:hypothetical protein